MELIDILSNLCSYDTRNPNGVASNSTQSKIKEEGYEPKAMKDCYCDNCFYGRTKLAEHILDNLSKLSG